MKRHRRAAALSERRLLIGRADFSGVTSPCGKTAYEFVFWGKEGCLDLISTLEASARMPDVVLTEALLKGSSLFLAASYLCGFNFTDSNYHHRLPPIFIMVNSFKEQPCLIGRTLPYLPLRPFQTRLMSRWFYHLVFQSIVSVKETMLLN